LGVGQPIHKFPTTIMGRGGFFRLFVFDLIGPFLSSTFRAGFFEWLYIQDGPPGQKMLYAFFAPVPNLNAKLIVSLQEYVIDNRLRRPMQQSFRIISQISHFAFVKRFGTHILYMNHLP
jgi:hypothetical protein